MPSGVYIRSEETKNKLRTANLGRVPWNKGRKGRQKNHNISGLNGLGKIPWNKDLKGFRAGEKSHLWKGGISRGYKNGYYSFEYRKWRKDVFERDGYKCQRCGSENCYLTAHHIKSFAHYPELRYDLNNGQTLCEDCHKDTDNYKGRGTKKLLNNSK